MTSQASARRRARLLAVLLGAAGLSAIAAAASAQTSQAAPGGDTVGEVTVTARHRNESLQQVPIAVSVVSGDQAAAQNLNDIGDISAQVPVVDFRTGASNKDRTVFIRGAGTISTSPGVEPSVSTVIDGVVLARPGQATVDLLDLDHIEVLRGPQGTLFGKNASAGVVNIVTKSPTATLTGYVDAAVYEGLEYRINGGVSGPLIADKLDGLLAVFTGKYDGNVRNLANGEEDNGYEHTGGRFKLLATPTNDLTLTLGADYTHSVDTNPTGVFVSTNHVAYPTNAVTPNAALAAALAASGVTPSADNRTINDNLNSSVHDDNGGVSLQADWNFGDGYRLTSITAWRGWRNVQYQDYDQTDVALPGVPQGVDTGHVDFHQISEELRIASPKDRFIDYVAGLYYLQAVDHEIYERDITQFYTPPTPALAVSNSGVAHYGSQDDNYAVFGEANVNFTKDFRLIAGYREVWDDLSFYHDRVATANDPAVTLGKVTGVAADFSANGSTNKAGYAGRLGLQYNVTPDVMAYATYSRGYKGPAYNVFFNMAAVNTPPLNPETSNSYEVGLKASLFDHRLQADLSAFITDFDNYQANFTQEVNGGLVTNLINAGSVTTRGVEGDITARPTRALTLALDFAYDDAYVVDFHCPAGSPVSCNINGEPLPFAPRWKTHLEGDYRVPVGNGFDVDIESDYNWQSQVQYSLAETPDTIQGAYGIWNASIALLNDDHGASVRLLVKNLTDQHYSSYLAYGDLGGVVRWVPRDDQRYFGVNVRKTF
jgi:iron complex outermembrane receptor protein